jgi:L,D-transpeptidase ErfK/SrfK
MRVSHGCVRLYPENIELLYSLVGIGEKVRIINEPYLAGWKDSRLYFEAHHPLEDDTVLPEQHLQKIFDAVRRKTGAFAESKEQDEAKAVASAALGVPILVLAGDTQEIYARARIVRNTVTIDPDAPTLAEVRALLDEADDELDEPAITSND